MWTAPIYTMKYYAKIGRALERRKNAIKGRRLVPLSKSNAFVWQHFLMPAKGQPFSSCVQFSSLGSLRKGCAGAASLAFPLVVKPLPPRLG